MPELGLIRRVETTATIWEFDFSNHAYRRFPKSEMPTHPTMPYDNVNEGTFSQLYKDRLGRIHVRGSQGDFSTGSALSDSDESLELHYHAHLERGEFCATFQTYTCDKESNLS